MKLRPLLVLWLIIVLAGIACSSPKKAAVTLGDTGHLRNPSSASVAIAASADDLDTAIKALSVNDTTRLDQMTRIGHLGRVPNGTQVKVIDLAARSAVGLSQVRILDGTHAGQAWWVLDSSLAP